MPLSCLRRQQAMGLRMYTTLLDPAAKSKPYDQCLSLPIWNARRDRFRQHEGQGGGASLLTTQPCRVGLTDHRGPGGPSLTSLSGPGSKDVS